MSPQPLSHLALDPIRLVATDVDGTLTQASKMTSQLLTDLLRLQQAGVDVMLVTGRSAGWVSGIAHYFPVAGAIAENGGVLCAAGGAAGGYRVLDGAIAADVPSHRRALAEMFAALKALVPRLQASADNAFRLTDWTFDVADLTPEELQRLGNRCRELGWDFTYSTVQCHLYRPGQTKGNAIAHLLQERYPHLPANALLTLGDSPNDESMFDGARFPCSVGVANLRQYLSRLTHQPRYLTQGDECAGFHELVEGLLAVCP
ncbi:MAG: HAD family hydrolase [Cyanobacteria bacterium P01_A01_bin.135]